MPVRDIEMLYELGDDVKRVCVIGFANGSLQLGDKVASEAEDLEDRLSRLDPDELHFLLQRYNHIPLEHDGAHCLVAWDQEQSGYFLVPKT